MIDKNRKMDEKGLLALLAVGVALVALSFTVADFNWLGSVMLALAVVIILWVSVQFVRNSRSGRTGKD